MAATTRSRLFAGALPFAHKGKGPVSSKLPHGRKGEIGINRALETLASAVQLGGGDGSFPARPSAPSLDPSG